MAAPTRLWRVPFAALLVVSSSLVVTTSGAPMPTAAAPEVFTPGTYIIDMGATQGRTMATGAIKGYGAVYDLVVNKKVPVQWVINPSKAPKKPTAVSPLVDSVDFTFDPGTRDPKRGVGSGPINYSSGAFVVPAEFSADLTAGGATSWLNTWRNAGVFIDGPIAAPVTLPVYNTLTSWPKAVLDLGNGSIAAAYYVNAGIPTASYRLGTPASLTPCDDIFVMPHADPAWTTHSNLLNFNNGGGYIWAACHAVSVLENVDSPDAGLAPDLNFLSTNGLVPFGSHSNGTIPYAYPVPASDPILQFLGVIDLATQAGSEQIYLPRNTGAWRPTTSVLALDPDQADIPGLTNGPAAALVYGRGFGNPSNGLVMYEGGHTHNKGTADDKAAQRAFFNQHLLAGIDRSPKVSVTVPTNVAAGSTVNVSATITGGTPNHSYTWASSCGGTFGQATGSTTGSVSTTLAVPAGAAGNCNVRLIITDACGRGGFGADSMDVQAPADLRVTKTSNRQPSGVAVGDDITYTVSVTNLGLGAASGVVLTDTLPAGVSLVSATPSVGTCSPAASTITCDLTPLGATIANGATVTITVVATALGTGPPSVTNTASVTSTSVDPTPGNNTASVVTPVFTPSFTVDKTPSRTQVAAGGAVTYTYVVTNTGTATLTTVGATDDRCAPLARGTDSPGDNDALLEVGEAWRYTCTSNLAATTTNIVTVNATDPSGTVRTQTDQATVTVVTPAIAIAKSPNTQVVPSGGSASFIVTVTNTGDVDLANVVVSDPLAPGCATTVPELPVGGEFSISCTVSNITSGFTNTASVSAPNPGGGAALTGSDTGAVTVGSPALVVAKTAPAGPFYPGDTFDYTVTVTNTAAGEQTSIAVTDTFPAGLAVTGPITATKPNRIALDRFDGNASNGGTGWAGDWVDSEGDFTGGDIRITNNWLELRSTGSSGKYAERDVDLSGFAGATLQFDCSHDFDNTNQVVTVTVEGVTIGTFTETTGGCGATTNRVSLPIPAGQMVAGATIRIFKVNGKTFIVDNIVVVPTSPPTVGVTAGNLPTLTSAGGPYELFKDETITFTIPVQVNSPLSTSITSITNTAAATSAQQASPSSASGTVNIVNPDFTVTKAASVGTIESGGSVTYTVQVNNTGNGPLSAVAPTDAICTLTRTGGDTNSNNLLDTTETWTYTCTRTLAVDTTNTVSVTATDSNGGIVGPRTAQATVDVTSPALDLAVSVAPGVARPGDPVTFTYVLTNTGDVPLSNAGAADPACSPLGNFVELGGDGDLVFEPGEQWSFTCTTAAAATTPVPSVVTATATSPLGTVVSDTGGAPYRVINPAISLTKTVDDSSVPPGTPVNFTLVADNTGDDPLAGVAITDDRCSPLTFGGGDTNSDNLLDLTELWSYTCTTSYTVDTTNTATVDAVDSLGGPVSATDDAFVNIESPQLTVRKTGDPSAQYIGDPVTYSYEARNVGETPFAQADVVVTDDRCAPVTRVTDNPGDGDGLLEPGERWMFSCTYNVLAGDVNVAGVVLNTMTLNARDIFNQAILPQTFVAQVNVLDPSIGVTKTANPTTLGIGGGSVTYDYVVVNTSTFTTTSNAVILTTITDDTCSPVDPVDLDLDGKNDGDINRDGQIDFVSPGVSEQWLYSCTANVLVTTTNTVTVDGVDTLGNAVAQVTDQATVFVAAPALVLTKTAGPIVDANGSLRADAGDTVQYSFTVENTGNQDLDGLTVTDPLLPSPAYTITCADVDLALGESTACTVSAPYELTQVDIDAGAVVNIATASATAPGAVNVQDTDTATVVSDELPAMTLVKTGVLDDGGDGRADAGDTVAYTFLVTNTGNQTLDNLVVTDTLLASPAYTITCPATTLAPGASTTCTASPAYPLTQADLDAGNRPNTATADADDPDGDPVQAPDDFGLPLPADPSLQTVKSSPTADFDAVGDVISYTITVTNTGNVTVSNLVVSDPTADAGSISCTPVTPAALAPGDSLTCSATHTVTQVDVDAGSVVNVATATGEDPDAAPVSDPSAVVTVPAVQLPNLTVVKASSTVDFDAVGDVIDYTITVTNTGNVTLDGLVVTDPVADAGSISCPGTVLDPAEVVVCVATHTVTQVDLDNGSVVNTATAAVTDTNNTLIDVDSNQITVPAVQNPAVTVDKATSSAPTDAGDVIAYSVVITNTGNVTLNPVTLDDPIADAGSISCDAALLAPGGVANCTLQHTVTQAEVNAGEVRNTATATFTPPAGGPLTQNSNEVVVTITPTPSLVTTKATTTADYDAVGDVISYTFTVTNTGNVTLSGVVIADPVTDDPPVCTPTTLDPGDVADCTALHTVVQGDLDAGSVVNVATGNGTPPVGAAVEDPSNQITVPAVQTPSITVTKALSTGGITEYSAVGEIIDYTFTVTNTGNVTLTGVAVTDPVTDSAPVCLPTTLAPTATATCTAQHTITQVDLDAGSVVNTADVSATPPSGPNVTDISNTVTVPAVLDPELTVGKVALDVNYAAVGDVLDYTITVQNTGNVTLDPVVVTDDNADAAPVCDVSVLAPNAIATCTASHVVDQADLDAGQVDNIASATGTPPIGAEVTDDSPLVSVPAVQTPSVLTTKSTTTVDYDAVGDVISYTITVQNTGNVTLTGVGVSDAAADATPVCAPTTLAPTEVATCTATHTIVQADLDAGSFTNIATGSGTPPIGAAVSDPSDPVTVPAVQIPTVLTTKSTTTVDYDAVGDVISYTITVQNTGNVTLTGVGVIDAAADATPVCAPTTLAPTEVATCTATHTIVQADLDAGSFTNIATGSGTPPIGAAVSDPSDPVTVSAVQTPSVLTTKSTVSTSYTAVGDVIVYSITVQNTGNVTLTGVSVSDPIADATPVCAPTTLAPTETSTCTAQHTIDQDDLDAGSVVNIATGSGTPPTGPAVSDPSDPVTVPAVQNRTLEVVKSTTTADFDAVGDVIDYTFIVTNPGNVTLTAVEVADPLADAAPVCSPTTLAPTETATCAAEHTVDQGDLDAGSVVNVADASAQPPSGPRITDPSNTVTVPAVQLPSVLTTKGSTTVDFDAVGDVIGYTITVENTGNVTLTGVSVSDPIADATPVCVPTTLAPSEVATCTATHTVTQADLDAGQVSNTATGSGVPPFGAAVSDPSDEVIVPAVITRSVLTTKSTATTDFDAVGDVISYTITVQNTGNVTLTGVSVSDPIADATPVCVPTTLAPAATATCSATHTVTQTDLDNGQVTNIATGSGQPPTPVGGPVPRPVTDPSDAVVVPAVQTPSVLTTKTLDAASITSYSAVGDLIEYVITVENTGNVTLTAVAVADANADSTPVCAPTTLAPTETATCTATHTVTQGELDNGQVTNIATGSGLPPTGLRVSDPSDQVVVPAVQTPAIVTTKTTSTADFDAVGDVISYTITVENTGNLTVNGVAVADANADAAPVCAPTTLAPTETATCTATHTVTQADLDAGQVLNVATGTATAANGASLIDPSDQVAVPAVQTPSVLTVKSSPTPTYSAVGAKIDYVITVTNTGNVTLGAVSVSDPNADAAPSCSPITLAPGQVATCTAQHTITQADLDAVPAEVVNVATGSAQPPTPPGGPVPPRVEDASDPVVVPATRITVIEITKSTATADFDALGDVIDYSLDVRNAGNITLTNVTVTDPVADTGSISCPATTLAPGAAMTCTALHTVEQTDLDAGLVLNVASVTSRDTFGDSVIDDSNVVIVPAVQTPSITTTKALDVASISSYAAVGDVIDYVITVTNSGNVTLTSVSAADPVADGAPSCSPTTLAPTEAATCTARHTVTQADLDRGRVLNVATGSGAPPPTAGPPISDPSNQVIVPAVQMPQLTTAKSTVAATYTFIGEVITYDITVTNTGNVTITGVVVSDPNADAGSVSCDVTSLAPSAVATCTAVHTVTLADLDGGVISNVATADGLDPNDVPVSDPSPRVDITATRLPALSIVKATTQTSYNAVGVVIPYTLVVTNTGNVTVSAITVTDPNADTGSITCPVATLAPSASTTCTATHTVTQADLDAGRIDNTAGVSGTSPGGGAPAAASNLVSVPAATAPSVSAVKSTTTVDYADVGDVIDYTIVITNTGNTTLNGVSAVDPVADAAPVCSPTTIAPNATSTCTAQHTVVQADLDAGQVVNVATAQGTPPIGPAVTAASNQVVVPADQAPFLITTKALAAGSPTQYSAVGEVLSYTITVLNTGNVTLTAVAVSDPTADAIPVCTPTTLAPGDAATCPATHTITQADLDGGSVVNIATGSGQPPAPPGGPVPPPINDVSSAVTVPGTVQPALSIAKATTATTYDTVGQVVRYTFTVTNTGNVTLSGVAVTDPNTDAAPVCSTTTLAPAETATCTGQHTVSQADIDNGELVNTADASGLPPGSTSAVTAVSNTVIVPATQRPAMSVVKAATLVDRNGNSRGNTGEVVNYTIVATNTGNVTLPGLVISDPMLTSLTCTPGQPVDLAVGARLTCTGSHTINAADVAKGQLVNTATASTPGTCAAQAALTAQRSNGSICIRSIQVSGVATVGLSAGGGSLPRTGSDATILWRIAATLVVAGGVLWALSRRRRPHALASR